MIKRMRKKKTETTPLVVKRHGKSEAFDERKLYASIYAACYIVQMREKGCERAAHAIVGKVKHLFAGSGSVQAAGMAKVVAKELEKRNPHAAFMYATHRDVG